MMSSFVLHSSNLPTAMCSSFIDDFEGSSTSVATVCLEIALSSAVLDEVAANRFNPVVLTGPPTRVWLYAIPRAADADMHT